MVLLLLTLPLTLELALLTVAAIFLKQPAEEAVQEDPLAPSFRLAVLVPAHNEQELITSTVASLLLSRAEASTASIRIVVIAHNCMDETAERARLAGAEVRLLDVEGGKGSVLAFGFATIAADGYLVIDADSKWTWLC